MTHIFTMAALLASVVACTTYEEELAYSRDRCITAGVTEDQLAMCAMEDVQHREQQASIAAASISAGINSGLANYNRTPVYTNYNPYNTSFNYGYRP